MAGWCGAAPDFSWSKVWDRLEPIAVVVTFHGKTSRIDQTFPKGTSWQRFRFCKGRAETRLKCPLVLFVPFKAQRWGGLLNFPEPHGVTWSRRHRDATVLLRLGSTGCMGPIVAHSGESTPHEVPVKLIHQGHKTQTDGHKANKTSYRKMLLDIIQD